MSNDQIQTPPPADPREAKARAKAEKAYKKASRPWYKKKRFILPLAFLVIIFISIGASGGEDNTASTGNESESTQSDTTSGENTNTADSEEESAAQEEPESNFYEDEYGTFKAIKQSGNGDSTFALPKGASAGIVTMSYNGSGNFGVNVLDSSNQPTGDLLANTIGSYKGTAAYGLNDMGESVKLQITASGPWTATVKPISSARELPNNATGTGDAVYVYNGGSSDWAIEHAGNENIAVIQYADFMPNLMVNDIGKYSGTVPAFDGPSVVTVTASGKWTIQVK